MAIYGEKMKTDAEQKFRELMKEAIQNSDYEAEIDRKIKEFGYDKAPDIETLIKRAELKKKEQRKARRVKHMKIAGFVIAVFIVSGAINSFGNSNVALAGLFEINNFMFNLRHGFVIDDFQFKTTQMGRKLIIEKEEQIPIGRDFLRSLIIPKYIPDGYNFSMLNISNNPRNEYFALFVYNSEDSDVLMIKQEKISPHNVVKQLSGAEAVILVDGMRAFFLSCTITGTNTIFVTTQTDFIQISGRVELDELIRIFEMLE